MLGGIADSLAVWRDGKARGRLALPVPLPHGLVSGLDIAAKAIDVEQRAGGVIGFQLASDGSEQLAIGRELEGQRFVFFEAIGDEVGQAGRVQEAASDPPRKCRTSTG